MAKVVLTTKVDPTYDDLPEERYHFPQKYLRQVEKAIGDWVVYYEPRRSTAELSSRGGRQSYFATARLLRVEPDPNLEEHYYAFVTNYLEFDHPVPFKDGQHYFESSLQREDGQTNRGAFGIMLRTLSDSEYDLIMQAGFVKTLKLQPEPSLEEIILNERPIIERVVSRPFRDAAFAVAIKEAYNNTCAMTGLKITNGRGRTEVQAAHIQPVSENGPDSLRNGVALSGTIHWMFDNGLVSIDDDYSILIDKDRLPETAVRLLNQDRRLRMPARDDMRPHRHFLNFHREKIFKK